MNISFKDLPPHVQARVGLALGAGPKSSKYRNKPTNRGALKFDSKKEAERYDQLILLRRLGEVRWFIRQAPFELPGGTVYKSDFLIVWKNGDVTVEDVKSEGTKTQTYKVKKREVEAAYGIVINEV